MKLKKVVSILAAIGVSVSSFSALAYAPSYYDGKEYTTLGLESEDSDGEINLAVIAKSDVTLGNTMYIQGSVYSAGDISVIDGAGNTVDGLFISGTGNHNYTGATGDYTAVGYKIVGWDGTEVNSTAYSSKPNYNGAIYDANTSFECEYEDYEVPEIDNNAGAVAASEWGNVVTISEDTYFESLSNNNNGLIIDATEKSINIVIGTYDSGTDGYFTILGDNEVNIYIESITKYGSPSDTIKLYTQKEISALDNQSTIWWCSSDEQMQSDLETINGNENVTFYLNCDDSFDTIDLEGSRAYANVITSKNLDTNSSTYIIGNFTVGGNFSMTASTLIWGTVCAPNSTTFIGQSATLYGQLHTNNLDMAGAGAIIYQSDSIVASATATDAPTATEAPAATEAPKEETAGLPSGSEIDLTGLGYAYIFGYEPDEPDEGGYTEIYMAPDDDVTREQVAAMIMRMIDQKNGSTAVEYELTDNIAQHEGAWYARGLAYLASKCAFDGIETVNEGSATRGEVAKLVAFGLNLTNTTTTDFTDIDDNEYKAYIEIMAAYGYMNGTGENLFEPNRVMTRAEFCQMFNNIIERNDMGLQTADGTTVTADTYSIVDISGHWGEETILKATSAYDENGYVDLELRQANIRNKLDNYDGQTKY